MRATWIWSGALLVYAVFSLWYTNWRGPMSAAEIESFVERRKAQGQTDPGQLAAARAFFAADDGREFFMLNLIRLHPEPVQVPGSDERAPARRVLEGYTRHFMSALFRRAGHPAFGGPAAGRYLETWGVEPDPGWTFAGVIRYRSRRDMAELASAPEFEPAHVFKVAAMSNTLAFPVAPGMIVGGPRMWIPLALALLASLAHLALALLRE